MAPVVFAEVNSNDQQPRARKPHFKSRNGCERCKSRRVKCDEQFPTCGGCIKRGITCKWPKCRNSGMAKGEEVVPRGVLRTAIGQGGFNMMDLRLLHHFRMHTVQTTVLFAAWKEIMEQ